MWQKKAKRKGIVQACLHLCCMAAYRDGRPKQEHHLLPGLDLFPLSPSLNNAGFSSPLSELESVIDCLACWSPYQFISVIQLCGDFIVSNNLTQYDFLINHNKRRWHWWAVIEGTGVRWQCPLLVQRKKHLNVLLEVVSFLLKSYCLWTTKGIN